MLRKFIVLLLCLMLCGCTQQQGNGENTTSSTSSTTQSITEIREDTPEYMREQFVEKGYMDYLCPKSIYLSYTSHVSDVFDTDRIQIDLSLSNENG
ncbi:MAG: hypothetical protein IKL88_07005, partial [Erysipelotrichales bacterium]|nr:hypothetical protein [Erysipelotrichales bacterium]